MPYKPPYHRSHPGRPQTHDPARKERDKFYSSAAWLKLRKIFIDEHPSCQRCLAEGRLTPSRIAHHRIERLDDADLALDQNNLEALCDRCHTGHHKRNVFDRGGGSTLDST
jgi:5-methylcytosine-specific restriction protein A